MPLRPMAIAHAVTAMAASSRTPLPFLKTKVRLAQLQPASSTAHFPDFSNAARFVHSGVHAHPRTVNKTRCVPRMQRVAVNKPRCLLISWESTYLLVTSFRVPKALLGGHHK